MHRGEIASASQGGFRSRKKRRFLRQLDVPNGVVGTNAVTSGDHLIKLISTRQFELYAVSLEWVGLLRSAQRIRGRGNGGRRARDRRCH